MARKTYDDVKTHCVVCTNIVPEKLAKRRAITCSDACLTIRNAAMRAERDAKECRYCKKPSTLEARAAFQRFRRIEGKRPDLLYPQEYEAWKATLPEVADSTPEAFVAYRIEQGLYVAHPWLDERGKRIEKRKVQNVRPKCSYCGDTGFMDSPGGGEIACTECPEGDEFNS